MPKKREYVVFSADNVLMIVIGVCSTKDKASVLMKLSRYVVPNAAPVFMEREDFIEKYVLPIERGDDSSYNDDLTLWGIPRRRELDAIKVDETFEAAANAVDLIISK
jgi:hypothetical protein